MSRQLNSRSTLQGKVLELVGTSSANGKDHAQTPSALRLGEHVLDQERFELRRGDERIQVQPKVLQLLFHLATQRDRPVSNEELLSVLWPDERVTLASVKRAIRGARKALGDDGDSQSSIRTVRGRGYQLVLPVVECEPVAPEAAVVPEPAPSSAPVEPAPSMPPRDAYVGRHGALGLLDESMREAFQGRGRLVLLIGEPGIGKTRTLLELSRRAALAGADTWMGRCIEDEGAPAFWPWTQILREAEKARGSQRLLALMGKSAADIAEGIPELREWLPAQSAAASIDQVSARFRFFDGVTTLLKQLAQTRPVVLLFDDLQRVDQPTLRLLSFVARHLDTAKLLIVATLRPIATQATPIRESLANFVQEVPAAGIELEGLSPDDVDRYVELSTGQRGPQSAIARLHRLTGGNPLFLQHVLHDWQTRCDEAGPIDWENLLARSHAQGLTGSIARVLSGLDQPCRELLRIASILGTEFNLARVAQLLGIDAASLLPRIASAIAAGVVREVASAMRFYRFSHVLIRDALYEGIPVDQRAALHARAGALIEAEGGGVASATLSELAHHYSQAWPAHDAGKALHYTLRAADAAKARLAYEEAAAHFDRALQILGHSAGEPAQRMRLLLDKGETLTHAADAVKARAALLEAVSLARKLRANDIIVRAAILIADVPESGNVDAEQVGLLREALAAVNDYDPRRLYLSALLAKCSSYSANLEAREALAFAAIEQSKGMTDRMLRAETLHQCHIALAEPKYLVEREAIANDLDRLGHIRGDRRILWHAATARLQNCLERGDFPGVDSAISVVENLAAQTREPIFRWYIEIFRAMRLYVAGHLQEAEQASTRALDLGACVGEDAARHVYCTQVTGWQRIMGRTSEAEKLIREMTMRFPALPGWLLVLGSMEAGHGRYDVARRILEQVLSDLRSLHDPFTLSVLSSMAELCAFVGTPEMAKALYAMTLPYAELWGNIGFGSNTYGPVGRQLGMLALRAGELDAADAHLEAALRSSERAHSPTFTALICGVYAQSALRRASAKGKRVASEMLERAQALNLQHGFHGNAAWVRYIAKRAEIELTAT